MNRFLISLVIALLPTLAFGQRAFYSADQCMYYSSGDVVINPDQDPQRKFTFGASSDTAHTMTFGDGGTTAAQVLSVTASTSDADDDSELSLNGGGAGNTNSRGSYLRLLGNEATGAGDAYLVTGSAAGSDMHLQATATGGAIYFSSADTLRMTLPDPADVDNVDLVLGKASTTAPVFTIRGSTADGDDDGELHLTGAGTTGNTRGASITLYGNERAPVGGHAYYRTGGSNNEHVFQTSGVNRWQIGSDITNDSADGGNLVFTKDLTGIVDSTDSPAAAGSALADATVLTANVTFVTAADATKGVKFPAAPVGGVRFVIYNTANAVLKVWPGEATDNINANADGANVAVAAYGSLYCHASSADQWWCGEMANP